MLAFLCRQLKTSLVNAISPLQIDHVDSVLDTKPVKILYKDPEGINSLCINKVLLFSTIRVRKHQ